VSELSYAHRVALVPADPMDDLARAEARFREAQRAYDEATERRREAILAAYRAGIELNAIAETLGTTHEVPRRIVRQAGL
jgi:hypothetical protein